MNNEFTRSIVQVVSLTLIISLEGLFPLFQLQGGRFRHALRNLGLGMVNAVIVFLFFSSLTVGAIHWAKQNRFGLLNQWQLSPVMGGICAFLLYDFCTYWLHAANHRINFLWRFHRVHHADLYMDSTTALRFHTGEVLFMALARLTIIPLIGMSFFHIFFYELLLQPVIQFHHSNVALPERWDRIFRMLIVTPNMHRIHHSQESSEMNSNFASLFSFWDRLWRTFSKQEQIKNICYGLAQATENKWQQFAGMMKMPFVKI